MYLDNYQIYQPGEAKLSLGVRDYVLNGDYITLNANNVIDPQTLSFTCSDGVTVTPETDDGKIYRLVLGKQYPNIRQTLASALFLLLLHHLLLHLSWYMH